MLVEDWNHVSIKMENKLVENSIETIIIQLGFFNH